jgi:hypothetical protein
MRPLDDVGQALFVHRSTRKWRDCASREVHGGGDESVTCAASRFSREADHISVVSMQLHSRNEAAARRDCVA